MTYLAIGALFVISAAWLMQYDHMKKSKEILKSFVIVNCLGVFMLIMDAMSTGAYEIAVMNGLVLLCSALVLSKAKK
jgi:hypothetical protein